MNFLLKVLIKFNLSEPLATTIAQFLAVVLVILFAFLADRLTKKVCLSILKRAIRKTEATWDDVFLERKVFDRLAKIAPAAVVYLLIPQVFPDKSIVAVVHKVCWIYICIVGLFVIDAALDAIVDLYRRSKVSKKKPIRGFVQIFKLFIFFAGGVYILSITLDKSPIVFFSGLGAFTAVLMLIFKDPILNFVGGFQLAANDMVRVGDWIEMPKYGADGDVVDISLTAVTVQNWDKTYTTIPPYALVSDSFKNWRGMSESGGRRIKRALNIDMNTIKFCPPEMIEKFKKIQILKPYIESKEKELSDFNTQHSIDETVLVNGRRMTNVGTFRAYIVEYLKAHPKIHKNMTFLVRHLPPGEHGLPIEIYVFSNDQIWANYEAIQADIFDHILSVVPEFDLRVFQAPSGSDFKNLVH